MVDPTLGRAPEEIREWLWIPYGVFLIDKARVENRLPQAMSREGRGRYIDRLQREFQAAEDAGRLEDLHGFCNFAAITRSEGIFLRVGPPFSSALYAYLWGLSSWDPVAGEMPLGDAFSWPGPFPALHTLEPDLVPLFSRVMSWLGSAAATQVPLILWKGTIPESP